MKKLMSVLLILSFQSAIISPAIAVSVPERKGALVMAEHAKAIEVQAETQDGVLDNNADRRTPSGRR